jgi:predicted nucleic acid-binding protein
MNLSEGARYLLDVNVLIALAARSHVHHGLVKGWFYAACGAGGSCAGDDG